MPCEERARLAAVHVAAIAENNESASAIAGVHREGRNDDWQQEAKVVRAACREALSALDGHISEHGC